MLLIGSRAIAHHLPKFRAPKDWDIILTYSELRAWFNTNRSAIKLFVPNHTGQKVKCRLKTGTQIEFEIQDSIPSSDCLVKLPCHSFKEVDIDGIETVVNIPSLRLLALLKKSHLIAPIHWWKNIADYHAIKSHISGFFEPEELRFFKLRRKEIETRMKTRPNLNMDNEDFFAKSQGGVGRQYDHDSLHRAICFNEAPMHHLIRPDSGKAMTSKRLWNKLSFQQQIQTAQEEAMVIALERKIIPILNEAAILTTDTIETAYRWAIMRLSTTMTSGWFRDFLIEEHPRIVDLQSYDFVTKFQNSKEVKLYEQREVH